jgi:hypothetical protein
MGIVLALMGGAKINVIDGRSGRLATRFHQMITRWPDLREGMYEFHTPLMWPHE